MGAHRIPPCPECGGAITVRDLITDSFADCPHCGKSVSLKNPERDTSNSPSVQKSSKTF